MKRFLLLMLISLLFLTISLLPSNQVGASPVQFSSNLSALELIAEVNALRASSNLPPYQVNSILMTVAQSHADYLASTGVTSHFSADGNRPYQRAIAAGYSVAGDLLKGGSFLENIDSGTGLTVTGAVGHWKGDADNLKTLMSPALKDVGVGVAASGGVTYYVLDAGVSMEESAGDGTLLPTSTASALRTPGSPTVLIVTNTPLEDGAIYHQVQQNEALWSIALAYNTTVEQLKLLNGLATNDIFVGQKLVIQKSIAKTPTLEMIVTATFGIPTSTATRPVLPTVTSTSTPLPAPPTSRQSGGMVLGAIIIVALLAAGIGSWMGRKKPG